MDRQYDLRALLIQIEERLSNEDRHRLHFLVGDIIPRTQREDVTRAGTLTLMESLFDRDIINQDYLDFLIRTFNELKCYDAVKRLKEFQIPKQPSSSKEDHLISSILKDNIEIDKLRTIDTNILFTSQGGLNLIDKTDVNKAELPLTPEPNEILYNINNLKTEPRLQKFKTFCFNFRFLWFLYILLLLLILGMIIYVNILISNKSSKQTSIYENIENVYLPELGNLPSDVEGTWFDHSQELSLTYADRLIRLDAYAYHNMLFSINFTYSNHKTRQHHLKNSTQLSRLNISSLDFQQRNLQDISICYTNKTRTKQLVGLDFSLGDDTHKYFGSCSGKIHVDDSFSEHLFGYALGKTTDYLQGIQFLWFKICSFNELTLSCANNKNYVLPITNYYLD